MKTSVLGGLNASMLTKAIMRYTFPLAVVQVLCVMLFVIWAINL